MFLLREFKLRDYLNKCHPKMNFSFEKEKNGNCLFFNVLSWEGKKFVTTLYHKPMLSGIYTHFCSFIPATYIFDMIYTLASRCFQFVAKGLISQWVSISNKYFKIMGIQYYSYMNILKQS